MNESDKKDDTSKKWLDNKKRTDFYIDIHDDERNTKCGKNIRIKRNSNRKRSAYIQLEFIKWNTR